MTAGRLPAPATTRRIPVVAEALGYIGGILGTVGLVLLAGLLVRAETAWGAGSYPRQVPADLALRYATPNSGVMKDSTPSWDAR